MTSAQIWTPPRAANKIVKVVEAYCASAGIERFPLDVPIVAREAANIFGWPDPITQVQAANIRGFEGALFPNDARSEWLLLFNDAVTSPGRVRFTQAHELGHYVLHRAMKDGFQCGSGEVLAWPGSSENIETQADVFASYLLMPIDDFAKQVQQTIDLNVLGQCASRYGVSLTAAALKWLQFTDEKAVMVVSSSGFINWAWSSEPARKSGAFIASKGKPVELPNGTLAADETIRTEREGVDVAAVHWFKHADSGLALREMKITMDQYDRTLTLLVLPRLAEYWPPFDQSTRIVR